MIHRERNTKLVKQEKRSFRNQRDLTFKALGIFLLK